MLAVLKTMVRTAVLVPLAFGAIALAPAAHSDGTVRAAGVECHDYKYRSGGGDWQSCWDTTAKNCTICHQT